MVEVRQTEEFASWLIGLRDAQAIARINVRIRRLSLGNPGDVKPVGRASRTCRSVIVILLCGGDKRTQDRDIAAAKRLARRL
jgi:putative component of toxin-antitoxin plasmid stabilization module